MAVALYRRFVCIHALLFVLVHLPKSCISSLGLSACTENDNVLDCSHKNLSSVLDLSALDHHISFIDFSYNHIQKINELDLPEQNEVHRISFAHNNIEQFVHEAYKSLSELVILDLSYNKIRGSSLVEADGNIHFSFDHLKRLVLRGNNLEVLKDHSFSMIEFSSLEYLDLSYCGIKRVEKLSLNNLLGLAYLNLSHNSLTDFEVSPGEAQVLDLSYNKIQTVTKMETSLFLRTLYMDYNGIKYIRDGAFESLAALEALSLVGNKLRTIEANSLPVYSINVNLKQLRLDRNPWHCNCNMKWLLQTNQETKHPRNFSLICLYPSRLRGKNIFKVSASELKCSSEYSKLLYILIMFSAAALLVAALGFFIYLKRHLFCCREKKGGNYVAVYTHEDVNGVENTNVKITTADDESLVHNEEQNEQTLFDQEQRRKTGKVQYFDV